MQYRLHVINTQLIGSPNQDSTSTLNARQPLIRQRMRLLLVTDSPASIWTVTNLLLPILNDTKSQHSSLTFRSDKNYQKYITHHMRENDNRQQVVRTERPELDKERRHFFSDEKTAART